MLVVVPLGLGSTIGIFLGGIRGAAIGAVVGIIAGVLGFVLLLFDALILLACAPVFLIYAFVAGVLAVPRCTRPASILAVVIGVASSAFIAWSVSSMY